MTSTKDTLSVVKTSIKETDVLPETDEVLIAKPKRVRKTKEQKEKEDPKPECPICASSYTSIKRAPVKCPFCSFECCKHCSKQYVLSKADPQCVQCHAIWTEEFLEQQFPLTWVDGELRHHLDQVVFEQEKSMLSTASREIYRRELVEKRTQMQHQFNILTNSIEDIRHVITRYEENHRQFQQRLQFSTERQRASMIRDMEQNEIILINKRNALSDRQNQMETLMRRIERFNDEHDEKLELSVNSIRCPKHACQGFLTAKYYCPVCKDHFCRDCHLCLGSRGQIEGHKCDSDLVRTIRSIARDTKPCPNCKMPIYKTEGCNMMFCTNCNTAFNWATGEIEKGRIHNPHYFDWLRRNGQDPNQQQAQPDALRGEAAAGQGECRIQIGEIQKICRDRNLENTQDIFNGLRLLIHIEDVMLARPVPEYANRHMELRIQYIQSKGRISEEEWKKSLRTAEYEFRFKMKYRQLVETLRLVFLDLYRKLKHDNAYNSILTEIHAIVDYFNENSKKLSRRINRRFFTGIHKLSLTEKEMPVLSQESPYNYETILLEYLANPTGNLDWIDEDEQHYIDILLYYTEIEREIKQPTFQITSPFLTRLFYHEPYNRITSQLPELISSRVCSQEKKRTEVLHKIALLILSKFQSILKTLFEQSESNGRIAPSVHFTFSFGETIECGWIVPYVVNLFSLFELESRSPDLFITSFFTKSQQSFLLFRAYRGVNPLPDLTSEQHPLGNKSIVYKKYLDIRELFAHEFVTQYDHYLELATPSQLWRLLYLRFSFFFQRLEKGPVSRFYMNPFMKKIEELYNRLINDPKYTRKKIIQKEYRHLIYLCETFIYTPTSPPIESNLPGWFEPSLFD